MLHEALATRGASVTGATGVEAGSAPTPRWASYGGILPLLDARAKAAADDPELLCRHAGMIGRIRRFASPRQRRWSGLEENDPRLVLRRLTREGIALAHDVDGCARFLLEALPGHGWTGKAARIVVEDLAGLDRPSLRVLARMAALAKGRAERFALAETEGSEPGAASSDDPLRHSYGQLVRTVRDRWRVTAGHGDPGGACARSVAVEGADFASAFAEQNYELADAALAAQGAGGLLMSALLLVNLGRPDLALTRLDDGIGRRSEALASLHYLAGLIRTKSCPDWPRAEKHFESGLALARGEAASMERAWLLNGAALLRTLVALRGPPQRREQALLCVLVGQEKILDLSLAGQRPEMLYLRYNVLANTALLLEAMGRFEQALDFWMRSFADSFGSREPSAEQGRLPYEYRKGVLALRAGDAALAVRALRTALKAAEGEHTYLFESRVLVALAAAEQARGYMREAARLLDCAASADERRADPAHLAAVERTARDLAAGVDPLRMPPSKLPSYFPHIDLDPEPGHGFNEKLSRAAVERPA